MTDTWLDTAETSVPPEKQAETFGIVALTNTETSPALYAIGTLTTCISFIVIAAALVAIVLIQRRRAGKLISRIAPIRKGS